MITADSKARIDFADGLLLLTVGIWGLNVTIVKLLLQHFQPLELSILRFTAAAAIFFLIVSIRERQMRLSRRDWGPLAVAALFGITLNQVCFVYSLKFTTATNLSLLLASTPAWAALLVSGSRMKPVGPRYWIGIVVSMLGVAAIVLFRPGGAQFNFNLLGDLLGIGVAISWAVYSVALRPLVRRNSVFKVSAWVLAGGNHRHPSPRDPADEPRSDRGDAGWDLGAVRLLHAGGGGAHQCVLVHRYAPAGSGPWHPVREHPALHWRGLRGLDPAGAGEPDPAGRWAAGGRRCPHQSLTPSTSPGRGCRRGRTRLDRSVIDKSGYASYKA